MNFATLINKALFLQKSSPTNYLSINHRKGLIFQHPLDQKILLVSCLITFHFFGNNIQNRVC